MIESGVQTHPATSAQPPAVPTDLFEEANSAPTMLERARALHEMGFTVFPLGSPLDEITPRLKLESQLKTRK